MALGSNLFLIQTRVAKALGIQDGDKVRVDFIEAQETFTLEANLVDAMMADVIIHDVMTLLGAKRVSGDAEKIDVTLGSGNQLTIPCQELWPIVRRVQRRESAALHFDGASRNNPAGPAGYGFHIEFDGRELVRGYVHAGMEKSSNTMEYLGLLEGVIWATRLNLTHLEVQGDSEMVIQQMAGSGQIQNRRLKAIYDKIQALFPRGDNEMTVAFTHIPREQNQIADHLAKPRYRFEGECDCLQLEQYQ